MCMENKKKAAVSKGFTLAEILITLTVIGIVAVIALPSLTLSVQEKAWDSQRKALHTRLSQALSQMETLANFGEYTETTNEETNETTVTDTAAETFISKGLSKVYKVKNVCDANHLADCGITSQLYTQNGSLINTPLKLSTIVNAGYVGDGLSGTIGSSTGAFRGSMKPAAFETTNGESIIVYYNPYCGKNASKMDGGIGANMKSMCASFVYDLNGKKAPNQIGKDMGVVTAFYSSDPVVVAPMPLETNAGTAPSYSDDDNNAAALCKKQDENSRLPDKEELMAMSANRLFLGMGGGSHWSSAVYEPGKNGTAFYCNFDFPTFGTTRRDQQLNVRCIKK